MCLCELVIKGYDDVCIFNYCVNEACALLLLYQVFFT